MVGDSMHPTITIPNSTNSVLIEIHTYILIPIAYTTSHKYSSNMLHINSPLPCLFLSAQESRTHYFRTQHVYTKRIITTLLGQNKRM